MKGDKCRCTPRCGEVEGKAYEWWLEQAGKTVRVTRGAFAGYVGRLSGSRAPKYGTVTFHTGVQSHAYVREVTVIWADLELVDDCCT